MTTSMTAPMTRDEQRALMAEQLYARFAQLMAKHTGAARGIRADWIANQLHIPERQVRNLVTQMREQGIALCGTPSTGYFIAANAAEVENTCQFLRDRALHSLRLEARLRGLTLPDLLGQMNLKT